MLNGIWGCWSVEFDYINQLMQSVAQIVVDGARWKEERDVYLS